MDLGTEFLKSRVKEAVTQHRAFLTALEEHEEDAEDPRFRDLCSRHIPHMRDDGRMPIRGGPDERRPTVLIPRLDVGAFREQLRDDGRMPVLGGIAERRSIVIGPRLDVGAFRE